jgi:peptide-methionine (S)-S-oxide reductase
MSAQKSWLVVLGFVLCLSAFVLLARKFAAPQPPQFEEPLVMPETATVLEPDEVPPGMARATFAAGCFWCTQAMFRQLRGVQSAVCGYCGGSVKNPTDRQVHSHTTGHAEAVQITYDPGEISYEELLEVFWQTHDPTTPDRQGTDVGPQYRSMIFCHTDEQLRLAQHYKRKLDASGLFARPIITEIVPVREFYRAAASHQDFFEKHPRQGYCQLIVKPKVEKFKKVFREKLKDSVR